MGPQARLFWGAVCIAFAPILVKVIALGPTTVGFYRCLLGGLVLTPMWVITRRLRSAATITSHDRTFELRRAWPYLLGAGLIFSADLALWHRSVVLVGAGIATVLANTQVFYLAIFGVLFMGERPNWRFYVSLPLAFGGAVMLVGFGNPEIVSAEYWNGVACGVSTGIVYASYILCLRRVGSVAPNIDLRGKMALVSLISAVGLGLLAAWDGSLVWPQPVDWIGLLVLAVLAQVVGWLLITKNLPSVAVSRAGLIILAQPALATILGVVLLGEVLSGWQWLGVVVTLSAIYLGSQRHSP